MIKNLSNHDSISDHCDEDSEYLQELIDGDLSEDSSMDSLDDSASSSSSDFSSEEDVLKNFPVSEEVESTTFLENAQLNENNLAAENLFNILMGTLHFLHQPVCQLYLHQLLLTIPAYNLSNDTVGDTVAATLGHGFGHTSIKNESTSASSHALAFPKPENDTSPTSTNGSDHNLTDVHICMIVTMFMAEGTDLFMAMIVIMVMRLCILVKMFADVFEEM